MPKAAPILTNWTAGEGSKRVMGRVDVAKYYNLAEIMENYVATAYGDARRRPGTMYVKEVKDSSAKTRLIPFNFSTEQAYQLELGNQYMRVYMDHGVVTETAVNITAATQASPVVVTAASHGYSDGDEVYIDDVVGMTELNGKFYRVANKTTNTFELTDVDGDNIDGTDFTAYSTGGTSSRVFEVATPWSTADLFKLRYAQNADVMYVTHPDYQVQKISRTGHTSWTVADVDWTDGPYLPDNDGATTITPSADTGAGITLTASASLFDSAHVGALWRIKDGWVKIVGYTSATVVTADVQVDLNTGPAATTDWAEGAWSDYRGYPESVVFYEQRLALASTDYQPETVWLSFSEEYENMLAGSDDADAMIFTIVTDQVNKIRWLSAGKVLAMGTSGGVFNLSSGSNADPLTPSNVVVKQETTYGAKDLQPKKIGNYVYYVQRDGKKVREFLYSFEDDAYKAVDMTLLSEHITGASVQDMDYQQSPDNVLWLVREDGQIATLTRQIEQDVTGWARQVLGASANGAAVVESVSVIPNEDGGYDEVWMIAKWTINGATRRYVLYLTEFLDFETAEIEDSFFVDCGLTYDGDATDTITGLDHLEGETVTILADGATHPNKTVTNGQISLEREASVVHVGLGYNSDLKTVRPEAGSATGTGQGKRQRIYEGIFRIYQSSSFKFGPSFDKLDTIEFRDPSMAMDAPVPLQTTDVPIKPWPSGWNRANQICVRQDLPLPLDLLSITIKMTVSD